MDGRLAEREALLTRLEANGYLTDPRLEEAMLAILRHPFVPPDMEPQAYEDRPLQVGHGQTISAPHMVALMTSLLQLEPDHRVLEIGTGRGYHAAVLGAMVPDGQVVSIEFVPELAHIAAGNLAESANVEVLVRDGALGAPEHAPFDALLITCAIPEIPERLLAQLAEGGHVVAPIGTTACDLVVGRKQSGAVELDPVGECLFVNAQGELGGMGIQPTP